MPLDYYNLDEEDATPQLLIEKYRNAKGEVWANSKWYDNSGAFEWKQCEVLKY